MYIEHNIIHLYLALRMGVYNYKILRGYLNSNLPGEKSHTEAIAVALNNHSLHSFDSWVTFSGRFRKEKIQCFCRLQHTRKKILTTMKYIFKVRCDSMIVYTQRQWADRTKGFDYYKEALSHRHNDVEQYQELRWCHHLSLDRRLLTFWELHEKNITCHGLKVYCWDVN